MPPRNSGTNADSAALSVDPAASAEAAQAAKANASTEPANGYSVAIVDDHEILRGPLAASIVAARPHLSVVYSGDSPEAVLTLEAPPSIVLLDLNLHGNPPSPDAVAELAARGCRILVLSALQEPESIRAMTRLGVAGFISKEAGSQELLEAIDAALVGDPIINAEVASALTSGATLNDPPLSDKEQQVLILFASGLKIRVVARRLGISPNTVKTHLKRIREKHVQAGRPVPTQTHMLKEATRRGLVP